MLDHKPQTDVANTAPVSAPQYQVLLKFLSLSARPETGGEAAHNHLLTSLAIASSGITRQ